MSADIHKFAHATFAPEVGVVEMDPTTGEIPVVVVNRAQPHSRAVEALKAWRARLILPLLALLDLAKEYPLGAAVSAGTAVAVTAASVVVVATPPPPHRQTIGSEYLEPSRTASVTASEVIRPPAAPSSSAEPPAVAPAATPSDRPSARRPSARHQPTLTPEAGLDPTLQTVPRISQTAPSPSPTPEPSAPETVETSPAADPPSKPALPLLPTIDIDVPLIDEDPVVDAVCGLLPIGCPIS